MEISLESYELYNNIFIAESELFSNLTSFGADIVNESGAMMYIHEGMKETINNYIVKITEAIEKAWEKFKELVMNKQDDVWLKTNEKKILSGQPSFTIHNFPEYDLNKLSSIKLIPLNYEEMKDSLSSREAFMSKYYPDINNIEEGSLNDKLEEIVLKSRKDIRCTNDTLRDCYKFCSDIKSEINKLEIDLKTINNSNKNIERLISSISMEQSMIESVNLYNYYLTEADNDQKSDKMTFTDDAGGPNKNSNSSMVKEIQVYISCSTNILTAKMKLLKDMKKEYMNILKHFAVNGGKNVDDNNNKEDKEEPVKGDNQIKI